VGKKTKLNFNFVFGFDAVFGKTPELISELLKGVLPYGMKK
jgi:hypothetical protein